jgi:hypothetical protein
MKIVDVKKRLSRVRSATLSTMVVMLFSFAPPEIQAVPNQTPDNGGGSVGCGADGICNAGQCSSDPDCPADIPKNTDDSPSRPISSVDTIDCSDAQEDNINGAASALSNNWNSFEQALETSTGNKVGQCLRKRFQENGKVKCVAKYKCDTKNGITKCTLGFGPGLKKQVKFFQTFFDKVDGISSETKRRGCYAALMVHEFSHTCEHYAESGPESRALATQDYWNSTYGESLNIANDCGMND